MSNLVSDLAHLRLSSPNVEQITLSHTKMKENGKTEEIHGNPEEPVRFDASIRILYDKKQEVLESEISIISSPPKMIVSHSPGLSGGAAERHE